MLRTLAKIVVEAPGFWKDVLVYSTVATQCPTQCVVWRAFLPSQRSSFVVLFLLGGVVVMPFCPVRKETQMPVLESTDRAMPRSALRHRPIERDVDQQGMTNIAPVAPSRIR